jgi:hypothetical protein
MKYDSRQNIMLKKNPMVIEKKTWMSKEEKEQLER